MNTQTRAAAKRAIRKLLVDLTDRRGLRQAWESIDLETGREIVKAWVTIVEEAITKYEESKS